MPTISYPNVYLKFSDGSAADPLSENGASGDFSEAFPLTGNANTFFVHWNSAGVTSGDLIVRWYPTKDFYAAADWSRGAPLAVINYAEVNSDPTPPAFPRWQSFSLPPSIAAYGGVCRIQIYSTNCTAVRVQHKTAVL